MRTPNSTGNSPPSSIAKRANLFFSTMTLTVGRRRRQPAGRPGAPQFTSRILSDATRSGSTLAIFLASLALSTSCGEADPTPPPSLRLAASTSLHNSGMVLALIPAFEAASGIKVDFEPIGTGAALDRARAGEFDAVIVHDRNAEDEFIAQGFGINRRSVMYNDFVLLGPASDPAGVRTVAETGPHPDVAAAFERIRKNGSLFISRGDRSGAHSREKAIWLEMGTVPTDPWYIETGKGMKHALEQASKREAYVLSDRGSFLANRDDLELELLLEGDTRLINLYSIIAVNPGKVEGVAHEHSLALIDFLTSAEARKIVQEFGVEQYGRALFKAIEDIR